MEKPAVLVAGLGAVGGFFGWKLSRNVRLLALVQGAHGQAVASNGLRIQSNGESFMVRPEVFFDAADIPEPELCIVAVKNGALSALLDRLAARSWKNTVFLSLMNGIDANKRLMETFGAAHVINGFCQLGAAISEPGVVLHRSLGKIFLVRNEAMPEGTFRRWVGFFDDSGIETAVPENFERALWLKFAWNAVFNTLSARHGVTTDILLETPELRREVDTLFSLVLEAAKLEGVMLTEADRAGVVDGTIRWGAFIPSSLQDLRAGKPLETGFFMQQLADIGRRHGHAGLAGLKV